MQVETEVEEVNPARIVKTHLNEFRKIHYRQSARSTAIDNIKTSITFKLAKFRNVAMLRMPCKKTR